MGFSDPARNRPPTPLLPVTVFDVDAGLLDLSCTTPCMIRIYMPTSSERRPTQSLTDIIDDAVSRTPHLQRPPSIHGFATWLRGSAISALWDDSCQGLQVVLGRLRSGGSTVCTMAVLPEASALQILIQAHSHACHTPSGSSLQNRKLTCR